MDIEIDFLTLFDYTSGRQSWGMHLNLIQNDGYNEKLVAIIAWISRCRCSVLEDLNDDDDNDDDDLEDGREETETSCEIRNEEKW